ncbi:MAG: hypothetical protein AAGG75_02525 [Bacteroidota bacterium]
MLQATIDQIPIRHDAFSYLIAFGAFNGLILSILIFLQWKTNSSSNTLLGFLLLSLAMLMADLFLGYTGLMKYTLHINDSTESLVLLLLPLISLLLLHRTKFLLSCKKR